MFHELKLSIASEMKSYAVLTYDWNELKEQDKKSWDRFLVLVWRFFYLIYLIYHYIGFSKMCQVQLQFYILRILIKSVRKCITIPFWKIWLWPFRLKQEYILYNIYIFYRYPSILITISQLDFFFFFLWHPASFTSYLSNRL